MAITRAQQAKQLLAQGGRIGLKPGGPPGGGATSLGSGRDYSSPKNQVSRADPRDVGFDAREAQISKQYSGITPTGDGGNIIDITAPLKKPKKEETNFQKFKGTINPFPLATAVFNKLSTSQLAMLNNAMQRQKYLENLQETDPETYGEVMQDLATMGYATNIGPMDVKMGKEIEFTDLGESQAKAILGEGYEDYLNRFKTEDTGGRDDTSMPMDPCKGPNPPAYCFVNQDQDDAEDENENEDTGDVRDIRFRADGGRINAMDGGIMGGLADGQIDEMGRQMYFLGKLVKKATRAVKKVAKSPVGKAALLYGLGAVGGSFGNTGKFFSSGMFNPGNIGRGLFGITAKGQALRGFPELAAKKGLFGQLGLTGGYGSLMPTMMGGITLASALAGLLTPEQEEEAQELARGEGIDIDAARRSIIARAQGNIGGDLRMLSARADGGRIGYQEGSKEPVAKKTMPLLDMDGKEMDLRENGGFVPIGRMEKADDVPARLSKNEFVFTADAVRNAGDGDVDKGAEVMYNMMKNLESGGDVSEESQGLEGARRMFQTSQRLEEVL